MLRGGDRWSEMQEPHKAGLRCFMPLRSGCKAHLSPKQPLFPVTSLLASKSWGSIKIEMHNTSFRVTPTFANHKPTTQEGNAGTH